VASPSAAKALFLLARRHRAKIKGERPELTVVRKRVDLPSLMTASVDGFQWGVWRCSRSAYRCQSGWGRRATDCEDAELAAAAAAAE
jgi:hypothetical protein